MSELETLLLNLSNKIIGKREELQPIFDRIASELFFNTIISTSHGKKYYFREIEFYFRSKYHNDPYVHCSEVSKCQRQGDFGEWHFHRFDKSADSFLNSKRNGVDISFGNKNEIIYGGILIREVEKIDSKEEIINGINNVVLELLNIKRDDIKIGQYNSNNLKNNLVDLATKGGKQVFDLNQPIHLDIYNRGKTPNLFKKRRVQLSEKRNEKRDPENYFDAPYNYFIDTYLSQVTHKL